MKTPEEKPAQRSAEGRWNAAHVSFAPDWKKKCFFLRAHWARRWPSASEGSAPSPPDTTGAEASRAQWKSAPSREAVKAEAAAASPQKHATTFSRWPESVGGSYPGTGSRLNTRAVRSRPAARSQRPSADQSTHVRSSNGPP